MNKIKSLHRVSAVYFFILAFAYVFMALAFRNHFLSAFILDLMRIIDLPFAFVALLYGGTTLALQINFGRSDEDGLSPWTLIVFMLCLLIFTIIAFINFVFPSII